MALLRTQASSSSKLQAAGDRRGIVSEPRFVTLTITGEYHTLTKTIRLGRTRNADDGIIPTAEILPTQQVTANTGHQSISDDKIAILVGILLGVFLVGFGIACILPADVAACAAVEANLALLVSLALEESPAYLVHEGQQENLALQGLQVILEGMDVMDAKAMMGETVGMDVPEGTDRMAETVVLDTKGHVGCPALRVPKENRDAEATPASQECKVPQVPKDRLVSKVLGETRAHQGHQGHQGHKGRKVKDISGKKWF
ncbi:hypothetical protein HIM_10138 [Hirsutella minnesotensis 3608]|uniref:Uncharacterized protein n=1 Tax=Hirsutella minnesotensis 3608 TaxID=1043627 RepID=A0A0F7ZG88_9HYPO|nr:hypothetical protein HIM_10138 [Hirsutella minnesotensis 3608]